MLYHRLPIENLITGSAALETSASRVDALALVPIRLAASLLLISDAAAALIPWLLLWTATSQLKGETNIFLLPLMIAAVALWLTVAAVASLYKKNSLVSLGASVRPLAAAICLGFGPVFLATLGLNVSSTPPITQILLPTEIAVVWVIASRLLWAVALRYLLRSGFCTEYVAVYGKTLSDARLLAANVERRSRGRVRALRCLTTGSVISDGADVDHVKTVRDLGITRVLVAGHEGHQSFLESALVRASMGDLALTYFSDQGAPIDLIVSRSRLQAVNLHARPLTSEQQAAKRAFDILAASIIIGLTLPLLITIGIAVMINSPGPALFRQNRTGLNGAVFTMWKFRTMFSKEGSDDEKLQTCREDPRVTSIGKFLRRSSLDELPQLVNVLRGDMSLVGPRPHAVGMLVAGQAAEELTPDYTWRHRVKPGITGWAQVNGCRGALDTATALRRRVALDLYYIENWSPLLDIKIIVRTISLVFSDRFAF